MEPEPTGPAEETDLAVSGLNQAAYRLSSCLLVVHGNGIEAQSSTTRSISTMGSFWAIEAMCSPHIAGRRCEDNAVYLPPGQELQSLCSLSRLSLVLQTINV